MTDVHIDSVHSRAICDEVGYHLRRSLTANLVEDPRHRRQLDRLRQIDLGQQNAGGMPSSDDSVAHRGIFASWTPKTWTPLRRRG